MKEDNREMDEESPRVGDELQILLNVVIPDELRVAQYANHVLISYTPAEVVITFAQIPPVRSDAEKEKVRRDARLDAAAIANVAVPHSLLPIIADLFNRMVKELEPKGAQDE